MTYDRSIFLLQNTHAMHTFNWLALRRACELCHSGRYYDAPERAALFADPAYGEVVWC